MADESRSERRKVRYRYLIDLGFTAKQARKLRDNSGLNIESAVKVERKRISRKPVNRRSTVERQRLANIQLSTNRTLVETRQRRFMSRQERFSNFSTWSSRNSRFPKWAIDRIVAYNTIRKLDKFDSFGHRRFYYWYVERIADFQNEFFADRDDSGMRHAQNIPLHSKSPLKRIA